MMMRIQFTLLVRTKSSRWATFQPAVVSAVRIWSGVSRLWTSSQPKLPGTGTGEAQRSCYATKTDIPRASGSNSPQRDQVYRRAPEVPLLWECRQGLRHFWECQAYLSYDPVPGPTLIRLVGRVTNIVRTANTVII